MTSDAKQKSLYQISFYRVALILCALPLFATFFCVTWSVMFNFESSTRTHCGVRNYLPSVSSAIGEFSPQKYVWRICIALHSTPRFLQAAAYYNFYTSIHVGKNNELYTLLATINSLAHVLEVGALVGLTYISSTENHGVHELCFILFMVGSTVYMILTLSLFSWGKCGSDSSELHAKSLRWKQRCCALNFSAFALSVYLFFRHNWYCEPGTTSFFCFGSLIYVHSNLWSLGVTMSTSDCVTNYRARKNFGSGLLTSRWSSHSIHPVLNDMMEGHIVYSLFCLFEYVVIISNICFHYTALWDFRSARILLLKEEICGLPR